MTDPQVMQVRLGSKTFAAVTATIAGLTLLLRIYLSAEEKGGVGSAILYLSQYFTILTNTLVLAVMLACALGIWIGPRLAQSLTIAIVGVGIVYHVALAHYLDLSGLAWLADQGVHTIVPALTFVWWVFFAPKHALRLSDVIVWTAWPLVYCVYILIRASFSGFYPYPFLNLPELGIVGLAQSILTLIIAFMIIGLALTGIARLAGLKTR